MGFNNGFEHVRLENKWKKLRIQYREAGMSEEAIQEMYNFDVQVVNSEQRYYRHSKDLAFNDADTEDTHSNDRYEEAILMADTYRETKDNGHPHNADAHCYILRQQHLFIIGVTIL